MGKIGGRVRHVVQVDVLDEGYRLGVYVGQFRRGYVVVGGVEEDTHPRVAGYLGDPDRAPEAPDDRRPVKLDGDVHTEVVGELGQVSYGSGHGVQRLDGDLLGAGGADDHLVGAQLFYKAGVLGVGLQVGDARVRRAEAHDLQLRAGDDGEAREAKSSRVSSTVCPSSSQSLTRFRCGSTFLKPAAAYASAASSRFHWKVHCEFMASCSAFMLCESSFPLRDARPGRVRWLPTTPAARAPRIRLVASSSL